MASPVPWKWEAVPFISGAPSSTLGLLWSCPLSFCQVVSLIPDHQCPSSSTCHSRRLALSKWVSAGSHFICTLLIKQVALSAEQVLSRLWLKLLLLKEWLLMLWCQSLCTNVWLSWGPHSQGRFILLLVGLAPSELLCWPEDREAQWLFLMSQEHPRSNLEDQITSALGGECLIYIAILLKKTKTTKSLRIIQQTPVYMLCSVNRCIFFHNCLRSSFIHCWYILNFLISRPVPFPSLPPYGQQLS